ncbi:MAG: cytochrome P450 [Acidimicrobiales bacterium]|nr:cytochrome P450 [Acidimicrobiales bacterium]
MSATEPATWTESSEAPVGLDPFAPGYFDDPYTQYARVREVDPVHRTPFDQWMLFRHDDVVRLLRDPSLSVSEDRATPTARMQAFEELAGQERRGGRSILNVDPPDHTRLRRLVQKAFTPRMVEELRPRVRALVDDALDRMAATPAGAEVDVIAELAFPLPFAVIHGLLGMPDHDRDEVRAWSSAMAKTLDPILTEDEVRAAVASSDLMRDHVLSAMAWKRREPADDLLTALIQAEDEGDVLDEEELLDQVVLLYIAGHETTVNLIGNGTLALLRHRDQLERLVADPSLDANAVDELLRYDSPVQFSRRVATAQLEFGGRVIADGSFVLTCLGSANRDPARWGAGADELDLGRPGAAQHLSFGSGIHHCLGASLARLEGQEAIGRLVRRFPGMALATDRPVWNGRVVLRGLAELPVTLG